MATFFKTALTTAFMATILVVTQPATAANPGIRHTVLMAGNVIESSAVGIYLCIGTSDGAQVGEVLDVVRMTRDKGVNPKNGIRFSREKVGTVRIDAIVDEHFAQATVVEGEAQKGDIVRLAEARGAMKD